MLESKAVARLEKAGLLVRSLGSVSPFANGYSIAKPKSTPGNIRKDYECSWGSEEIPCDAPGANLYPKESKSKWIFEIWEWLPGPGPGDFQKSFESIDEAIAAILEYYFGDPLQMNPPELLEIK
ncbi:hypothetical protein G7B40_019980 [Aetokthonos hydrillicola Thurmond2011]|jgi:hypothetical protein|uniref:Uncharacterized protein n=1 Tax=Aetokthonos hydrillicola Thurmond2011 TaxID=2712845 RepID=A0AAP5M6B8_9CYAN|nr:hypothetical protein [Aetokthonos hydrillicola]MBO3460427.1 hypothetical protein [Aetokthonos hydrillicola CCALA 1050]MBW4588497.1 hypothetical protein [Aetokthonos hydrillicola CCALA 1050]MDR9896826.1 hypothetical protein [Aetokthonos hydrillicola Thurmond2011]